ncbi:transglutaminaseTgpA domain-containing protein [Massilia aerilata]|uniref:TransglutaminaseTgpA domain-containing protein n=1 Tax=Massilia aerilata TaxID=453817 RepID=A0ABW0S226_9BURK
MSLPRFPLPLSRDKQDTLLLLASTVLVLLPHASHLPPWVTLVCGATLVWRAVLTMLGRRMPTNLLLVPLAIAAMAGVLATYQTVLGRDAGVAMLVLLVAFKMLEMHARRDLFVVVFLCFFLVLTNFFYSQSMGTAFLMIVSILALLTTQLSFQLTGAVPPLRTRLLMGARILALAAPLAALGFVLFPRVEGPLWGLPDDAHSARAGLSDSMAPGQFSNLARSDDPAFRVKFDGPPPAQPQLYWRGPVLGAYDGRTWTRLLPRPQFGRKAPPAVAIAVRGQPLHYEITLEPTDTRWLFALEIPRALPQLAGGAASVTPQLELQAASPVRERIRYELSSYVDFSLQAGDTLENAYQWLLLPYGRNPRALAAGERLRQDYTEPMRRVQAVLRQFATGGYSYTLQPPLLGGDAVDEFLYQTRAGFCEHYAGAFVFLMRAAGIPARVVTGYQGGELNPIDGYFTVRRSDAHAWSEVWLPRLGWVRIDPTAAVAPDRVQRNLAQALPAPEPFGFRALGRLMQPAPDSILARVRYAIAAANNGWNQWVLNYTAQRQLALMETLQENLFGWRSLALLALAWVLLLIAGKFSRQRRVDPVDKLYSALCHRLGQLGLPRAPDEGPTAYAARVAGAALAPEPKAAAAEFLRRYSAWRYAPPLQSQPQGAGLLTTLKQLLSRVR